MAPVISAVFYNLTKTKLKQCLKITGLE